MLNEKTISEIVMLGAGNVATHLATALLQRNFRIKQVFSRTLSSAEMLATQVGATPCNTIKDIVRGADAYIIALSDSGIEDIAPHLQLDHTLVVHTSGSLPLQILKDSAEFYGVLYPLQSFIKSKPIDVSKVCFCIEANNPDAMVFTEKLALALSSNVRQVSSADRLYIHLAAVFVSNFTNFMAVVAEDILNKKGISFDIMHPLIRESFEKLLMMHPWQAQTGPALRNDLSIIQKHLSLLEEHEDYIEIYRLISNKIIEHKLHDLLR